MPTKSKKEKEIYDKFLLDAKILNLYSAETGYNKKVVKWRNTIYQTASLFQVFEIVKSKLKLESE